MPGPWRYAGQNFLVIREEKAQLDIQSASRGRDFKPSSLRLCGPRGSRVRGLPCEFQPDRSVKSRDMKGLTLNLDLDLIFSSSRVTAPLNDKSNILSRETATGGPLKSVATAGLLVPAPRDLAGTCPRHCSTRPMVCLTWQSLSLLIV